MRKVVEQDEQKYAFYKAKPRSKSYDVDHVFEEEEGERIYKDKENIIY